MTMEKEEEVEPLIANGDQTTRKESLGGHVIVPLIQRASFARLDVLPFVLVYVALIVIDHIDMGDSQAVSIIKIVAFPVAFLSHLVVVLLQQWKVSVRCLVGYSNGSKVSMAKWTHCLVTTPMVGGKQDAGIVPVQHEGKVVVVNYHDFIFRATDDGKDPTMDSLWDNYETSRDTSIPFHHLRYPSDLALKFYTEWKGHVTLESVRKAYSIYGNNTTQIELPPFLDLLGQQLLAPFFLFQLFCVGLWSLDEYWYYAIFTLLALLMFESTVAFNRRKGLERLRGTLRLPYHLAMYRHRKWIRVRTDEIVPGDIVSLVARTPEIHVPADMVLLRGSAVIDEALLTGESVPQLKNALDVDINDETAPSLDMDDPSHKQSILFGGTMIVSHSGADSIPSGSVPAPPDGGVVCFTLRTGFETAQGSLLRSMAHSSMKSADGIHTKDTFVFVFMLLVCAVLSAATVLQEGWNDETRNRFRLVLHVIIIVTSVVPPELPMELTLAVTNSVTELIQRCNVYCTEPFRIPWAGQVDMCCFDKTGTLTSDEMQLRGVRLLSNDLDGGGERLLHPSQNSIPWTTLRIMTACHSLALSGFSRGQHSIIGDPLEKVTLEATGYKLRNSNFIVANDPQEGQPRGILIHHRFPFSSKLKRMTVLLTEDNNKTVLAVTKGAPETIKRFLAENSIPTNYDDVFSHHMGLGQRVLAMAYRQYSNDLSPTDIKDSGRASVEKNLVFAGFLVLDCPLKTDSLSVIKELRRSGHDTVMVTGDAVLTAAEVAKQVGIVKRGTPTYELREIDPTKESVTITDFHFVPLAANSTDESLGLSDTNFARLKGMMERSEASFCLSGAVLSKVAMSTVGDTSAAALLNESNVLLHSESQKLLSKLAPIISVFARHAPQQKEAVVAAFNLGGRNTLMCGDGTNDVGALKRAHVGISIISAPELELKQREATANINKARKKDKKDGKKKRKVKKRASLEESLRQLQETQRQIDEVELGDASIASPFTSRAISIKCCKDVLQQGRCTLVTMLQIYKILGVNCLVNALVLTRLHMHGVKQGDRQLTIMGMAIAVLFYFVTRGKPLPTLSPQRPPSSVLCRQALLSIAFQFAIHFAAITLATDICLHFVDPYDPSIIPDASFNPNVLNSCTFLLTMLATVNTFAINYRGRPYMQDLRENRLLYRSLQLCYAVILICVLEVFPPLNDLFQLTPFPETQMVVSGDDDWLLMMTESGGLAGFVREIGFPLAMCGLLLLDTVVAFACERLLIRVFEG